MGIRETIKRHESLRLLVYDDATGKPLSKGDTITGNPTIGYGRELSKNGISQAEADFLLDSDLSLVLEDIEAEFRGIPMTLKRQEALADMRYQMGYFGFRKFKKMIEAVKAGDWDTAAEECLDSEYANQCPDRALENAEALKLG